MAPSATRTRGASRCMAAITSATAAEIRQLFDRQAFERMVRTGYPEIADSVRAHVAATQTAPDGHIYLLIKIRGANGRHIEALYDMVREAGSWRINGVVAKPDPADET